MEASSKGPRRLYVVRHGERVDFAVGSSLKEWLQKGFDDEGLFSKHHSILVCVAIVGLSRL